MPPDVPKWAEQGNLSGQWNPDKVSPYLEKFPGHYSAKHQFNEILTDDSVLFFVKIRLAKPKPDGKYMVVHLLKPGSHHRPAMKAVPIHQTRTVAELNVFAVPPTRPNYVHARLRMTMSGKCERSAPPSSSAIIRNISIRVRWQGELNSG